MSNTNEEPRLGSMQGIHLCTRKLLAAVAILLLSGCAAELPLFPISPPGRLIHTQDKEELIEVEEQGVVVRIKDVRLWDGGTSDHKYPGVSADVVIENMRGGWAIIVKVKSISLSVDSTSLTLWPYITLESPEGMTPEMDNVEEILVMQGAPMRVKVALKACSRLPHCVPSENLARLMVIPKVEATLQISEVNIVKNNVMVSMKARFVPRMWDLLRFKLRRIIDS